MAAGGKVKRCSLSPTGAVRIGAGAQQQSDGGDGLPDRQVGRGSVSRNMHGRVAIPIPRMGIAAAVKQYAQCVHGADRSRSVKRCPPDGVGNVGTRASGKQIPDLVRVGLRLPR